MAPMPQTMRNGRRPIGRPFVAKHPPEGNRHAMVQRVFRTALLSVAACGIALAAHAQTPAPQTPAPATPAPAASAPAAAPAASTPAATTPAAPADPVVARVNGVLQIIYNKPSHLLTLIIMVCVIFINIYNYLCKNTIFLIAKQEKIQC